MVRLAVLLLGDRGLAEEAVQEAFVAVYRNWDGVRDKASLAGYVRAAVVNRCRSAQRGLVRARRLRDRMGSFRERRRLRSTATPCPTRRCASRSSCEVCRSASARSLCAVTTST